MKKLLELIQEDNGNLSSTRAQAWLAIICFCGDYIAHIYRGVQFSPEWTIVGIVLGILGLKIIQKPMEEKVTTPQSTTPQ